MFNRNASILLSCLMALAIIGVHQVSMSDDEMPFPTAENKAEWFQDAKFGLFLHWSAAVQSPETWERLVGVRTDDRSGVDRELMWSMSRRRIPREKYKNLPKEFNPAKYDAGAIARLAREAGMRYVVYTAKHHDGFAMYATKVDKFNIIDATPFGRDPLAELSAACKKEGVPFGFYYSQAQDWMHPGGAGNDWDGLERSKWKEVFPGYLEEKCRPQVEELLKNYGPIATIWFDTPATINEQQSRELVELVHSIQPQVMVNSRAGNGAGDYLSTGDNQVFDSVVLGGWETPATINEHWSYMPSQTTKSRRELLRRLSTIVSRGGNYLLNIGPTDTGVIPEESAARLREMGAWLKINGEAIYGTRHNPFLVDPAWGTFTCKPGRLYAHVYDWPKDGRLVIRGLVSRVNAVRVFGVDQKIAFKQNAAGEAPELAIDLPMDAPDQDVSVVELTIDGNVEVEPLAQQRTDGVLRLEASLIGGKVGRQSMLNEVPKAAYAEVRGKVAGDKSLKLSEVGDGSLVDWLNAAQSIAWQTRVAQAGNYDVWVIQTKQRLRDDNKNKWLTDTGHQVTLTVGDGSVAGSLDKSSNAPFEVPNSEASFKLGQIKIDRTGPQSIELKATEITKAMKFGLTLRAVVLVPVGQ